MLKKIRRFVPNPMLTNKTNKFQIRVECPIGSEMFLLIIANSIPEVITKAKQWVCSNHPGKKIKINTYNIEMIHTDDMINQDAIIIK